MKYRLNTQTIITAIALILSSAIFYKATDLNEQKKAETVLLAFAKAGDNQNVTLLESLLDSNYRIIMNQLFGSKDISIIDRANYLTMIKDGKLGGDERTVKIHTILMNGNTASAHVSFIGKQLSFNSIINLIKEETGKWKLVSEMPTISS